MENIRGKYTDTFYIFLHRDMTTKCFQNFVEKRKIVPFISRSRNLHEFLYKKLVFYRRYSDDSKSIVYEKQFFKVFQEYI